MTYPAEAEVFRTEVRKILAEELPADWRGIGAIPTEAETEDFVARWRAVLHRRGLLGITWPVEYGGRGLSQLHQSCWSRSSPGPGCPSAVSRSRRPG